MKFDFVYLGQTVLKYEVPLEIFVGLNEIYEKQKKQLPKANKQLVGKIQDEVSLFYSGPNNDKMHQHSFLPQDNIGLLKLIQNNINEIIPEIEVVDKYSQFSIDEEKELYHASKEEILSRIQKVPENIQSLLIVGHNPGFEEFISWILMGSTVSNPLKMTTGSFFQMALDISVWSELGPQSATLQLMIPGRFSSKL